MMIRTLVLIAVIAAVVIQGLLHEDEVGNRDWRLAGVGRVEHAAFVNTPTTKQIMVCSKEGVVAALSTLDKGTIRWRQILGEAQVCLAANALTTVVLSKRGVGHVFDTVSGSMVTSFSVDLAGAGSPSVSDCFLDRKTNLLHVVGFAGSVVQHYAFKTDDSETTESGPVPVTRSITTTSAVTSAKLAGAVNIWIERNGTGVDVWSIDQGKLTATDTLGWLEATSAAGDAFLSFYKDGTSPKDIDAGHMLRIMSAENGIVKAIDGKKGTSCKECRTALAVMDAAPPASATGDVVITIREDPQSFFLHVASKRFTVAYPGYYPPRVIAARQTAKKADVLLRAGNNHLLYVTVSMDETVGVISWERFEGITSPAQVRIARLDEKSLLTQSNDDLFGFSVDTVLLSTYGTLYRVPVAAKGKEVIVVADVSAALRGALNTAYACHAQYKDMTIDDNDIATIVAEHDGLTVVMKVELLTGLFTFTSSPVPAATFQTAQLVLDSSNKKVSMGSDDANTNADQYFYRLDRANGKLLGLRMARGTHVATPTWEVSVGGGIIASAAPKDRLSVLTTEHLRVFPNASKINEVRRKYPTQNIVSVATQNTEDDLLTIFVVDTITGAILATTQHRDARGPVHMAIVEHVIVYHFMNVDRMRYALGVLELFERDDVVVSDATAASPAQAIASFFVSRKTFSSLTARPPVVASMVLAFPGGALSALGSTTSYLGINRKQLVFAMADGHVHTVELRAVCFGGQANPQKPEEVYQHVILPSQNIVSHVSEVAQARMVTSTPTELESSSHVVVAGLDLFYTRVSAGKAYDMLNDDFNHKGLILVCGAMGVLSIVARFMAGRKALKNAWA